MNPLTSAPFVRLTDVGSQPFQVTAPPEEPVGRLTVVETVYHQPAEGEPRLTDSRYDRTLRTDEQAFVRRTVVTEERVPLEYGWLSRAVCLILHNEAPTFRANPTDDERRAAEGCVLEVSTGEGAAFAVVAPGESCRFQPADPRLLRLRCRAGSTKVVITLLPE